jgi:hypothetical protein
MMDASKLRIPENAGLFSGQIVHTTYGSMRELVQYRIERDQFAVRWDTLLPNGE